MSKKQKRRRFISAQKASILSEHLFNKKAGIGRVRSTRAAAERNEWQRHAEANLAEALEG